MYQALGYLIQYVIYFLILAGTITVMMQWLNKVTPHPPSHRYQTLEGLRGVCASVVMMLHICSAGGADNHTTERFFYLSAGLPVGLFFMLSGFLFFRKTLSGDLNIPAFLMGRVKRIYGPVLVVLFAVYLVAFLIGPPLPSNVILGFIKDIPLIYLHYPLGLTGDNYASVGLGPFWTLAWESRLYCVIPLLYWLLKSFSLEHKRIIIIATMVLVHVVNAYMYRSINWGFIMYFLGGFLIATMEKEKKFSSWIGLLILIAAIALTRYPYHTTTALYMTVVFYAIKCGCDYFGLLTSRPVVLVGTCSFSLYIVHSVIGYISHYYLYAISYYLYAIVTVVIAGIVAPLMYHYVERRCIS